MAIRGTIAKKEVEKKLAEAFGKDYLGEVNKKYYVQVPENNEMVQIAITMTCPKENLDFGTQDEGMPVVAQNPQFTNKERENIAELMRRVGL